MVHEKFCWAIHIKKCWTRQLLLSRMLIITMGSHQFEVTTLAAPFKLTLVGKFSRKTLFIEALHREFRTVGFKGFFLVSWTDPPQVLIHLDLEEDYIRFWMKGIWSFQGYPVRVFKWAPEFHLSAEPSILPVWVSLERVSLFTFSIELPSSPLPLELGSH